ncbi:MAG: hypothetical protein ACRDD1_20555 [Planctomycetia bacterium]
MTAKTNGGVHPLVLFPFATLFGGMATLVVRGSPAMEMAIAGAAGALLGLVLGRPFLLNLFVGGAGGLLGGYLALAGLAEAALRFLNGRVRV